MKHTTHHAGLRFQQRWRQRRANQAMATRNQNSRKARIKRLLTEAPDWD